MSRCCLPACLLLALHACALAATPLPSGVGLSQSKRNVLETYRRELASEDGHRKMLSEVGTLSSDPTEQAAILIVLTERGSSRIAFDALDQMGRLFDFDALAAKVEYAEKLAKVAKRPDDRTSAFNRAVEVLEESIDAGRLKLAERALKAAGAVRVKDPELRKELAERRKQIEAIKKSQAAEDKALAEARKALDKDPSDPVANECVGRHLAVRGDWSHALKHLARADVEDVRKAALAELAGGTDAAKQLAIADAWWNVAESAEKPERRAYQVHAVYWYTLAAPSLTGIAKARAEKRITEAGAVDLAGQATVGERFADIVLAPGVTMRLVKILASADGKVRSFWLGQTEVTQAQWQAVMGTNPSQHAGGNFPVESVTDEECAEFCEATNSRGGRFHFRLPSEAEWRHAFACGKDGASAYGSSLADLFERAWCKQNTPTSMPVAQKEASAFNLYDMFGNVWEKTSTPLVALGAGFDVEVVADDLKNGVRRANTKKGERLANVGLRVAADAR